MALGAGNGTATTPIPDPGTPGAVVATPGIYVPEFIAPNGVVLALNPDDPDFFTDRKGVSGLGLAPRELIKVDDPAGGVIVDSTRVRERTIIWPVRMYARTHLGFLDLFRSVGELMALTETLGPGLLRITRPDGSRRQIPCYYQSGFEQEAEDGAWLRGGAALNLLCPSPWWQDVEATPFVVREQTPPSYLSPYPSYATGQIIGNATFTNVGQRAAWPQWTIRGPMSSLTATNVRRGESFTITAALARGETMTVSTQPLQVRGPAGEQLISALDLLGGGVVWRLDPKVPQVFDGATPVLFAAAGTAAETAPDADDGTKITVEFVQQYETA